MRIIYLVMKLKFIVSCIIIHFYCNLKSVSSNSCFDIICIPPEYNKLTKPPPKNETTDVQVQFRRIQVLNINENESTITLKLAILMVWFEPRIFISSNATEEDKEQINWSKENGSKILPKGFVNHLWMPNAYIPHMHKIKKYNFVQEFETYFYLMDKSEKNAIGCQIEVETVLFCKMNFTAYPMDENTCYFTLGSYAHLLQSKQRFTLLKQSLQFDASQQVAQLDFIIDVKELPEHKKTSKDIFGTYQRTGFEVKFQRKFTTYFINYYVPSGILVVLSWVSNSITIIIRCIGSVTNY